MANLYRIDLDSKGTPRIKDFDFDLVKDMPKFGDLVINIKQPNGMSIRLGDSNCTIIRGREYMVRALVILGLCEVVREYNDPPKNDMGIYYSCPRVEVKWTC